jgi:hypothetical protein
MTVRPLKLGHDVRVDRLAVGGFARGLDCCGGRSAAPGTTASPASAAPYPPSGGGAVGGIELMPPS